MIRAQVHVYCKPMLMWGVL